MIPKTLLLCWWDYKLVQVHEKHYGPPYGWKNRVIIAVGRPGVEEPAGFPQVRRVSCTPAPGSELPGGRGPRHVEYTSYGGSRDDMATL